MNLTICCRNLVEQLKLAVFFTFNNSLRIADIWGGQGLREKFFQGVRRSMPGPQNLVKHKQINKKGLHSKWSYFLPKIR